ncbi:MAG: hypothetical protein A3H71_01250 [Candidatus Sungbacteria bacterium RIFCSPLOWO2_02_FULL_48_13b]|uniref:UDP-N-acetylglucosamine--N-acetylmuramyl-(pentapeptide) pyrophosphoryl-undecaprenol N-acetylglucosamine transferase n=2 Tax=Candidatus Sungiibacteriota TaxID=1817917 RepID=A0A1G2LJ22_9BACT|nr:MAG: hypothetical protein A3H71_01250 [Candidatus Sungbacteria bacterium RIFCSPLOWO2_02_FULL_48_13b]
MRYVAFPISNGMRIIFTGGGTGGHVMPLIAVTRELQRIAEDNRILDIELRYLGPDNGAYDVLKHEDIICEAVSAGKWRRYLSIRNFFDIFLTLWGIIQSAYKLWRIMPDVIFSKGGYASFPVLVIARIYRLPVIIHESDATPGIVNRWSKKFAKRIAVSFAKTAEFFPVEKTAVVGNPVRKRLLGGLRDGARDHLSIFSQKPVLLIFCGSQGAEPINRLVLSGLKNFINNFEIIHQTGPDNFADVSQQSMVILNKEDRSFYHPYPYLDETRLREAYAAADIILARAGSTIFEIAAVGKPSVLIPLPHAAQDHQRENAYEYAKTSGAVVIEEANATPNLVLHTILRIFETPGELERMREGATRFARIDAAETIAREILEIGLHH